MAPGIRDPVYRHRFDDSAEGMSTTLVTVLVDHIDELYVLTDLMKGQGKTVIVDFLDGQGRYGRGKFVSERIEFGSELVQNSRFSQFSYLPFEVQSAGFIDVVQTTKIEYGLFTRLRIVGDTSRCDNRPVLVPPPRFVSYHHDGW